MQGGEYNITLFIQVRKSTLMRWKRFETTSATTVTQPNS